MSSVTELLARIDPTEISTCGLAQILSAVEPLQKEFDNRNQQEEARKFQDTVKANVLDYIVTLEINGVSAFDVDGFFDCVSISGVDEKELDYVFHNWSKTVRIYVGSLWTIKLVDFYAWSKNAEWGHVKWSVDDHVNGEGDAGERLMAFLLEHADELANDLELVTPKTLMPVFLIVATLHIIHAIIHGDSSLFEDQLADLVEKLNQ